MDDFLQKLKNMVRIVLYGSASGHCRKTGPYQLPYDNYYLLTEFAFHTLRY